MDQVNTAARARGGEIRRTRTVDCERSSGFSLGTFYVGVCGCIDECIGTCSQHGLDSFVIRDIERVAPERHDLHSGWREALKCESQLSGGASDEDFHS